MRDRKSKKGTSKYNKSYFTKKGRIFLTFYSGGTKEEIGIHAIRMGNRVGEHDVIIGTANQTITLSHQAHSRALFAEGAIAAAEFLIGKPEGMYDMKSMVAAK